MESEKKPPSKPIFEDDDTDDEDDSELSNAYLQFLEIDKWSIHVHNNMPSYSAMESEKKPPSEPIFEDYDSDDEDDSELSNAYLQILEIHEKMRSTVEYQAELKKRGAPAKHRLVNLYLHKFPFEDQEDYPNSEFYTRYDKEADRLPNAREIAKRFLKQVRESNGYDVDCCPPGLCSPFVIGVPNPEDENYRNVMHRMVHITIKKINAELAELGQSYELVEFQNLLSSRNYYIYLLTFTVKETGTSDDAPLKTIQATLEATDYGRNCDYIIEEWKFKSPTTDVDAEKN